MTAAERMLPPDSSNDRGAERQVEVAGLGQAVPGSVHRRQPVRGVRQREVDDHVEPAGERLVEVGAQVGREDGQAVEGLHALQQVGALDVGVPVVGVVDLASACRRSRPPRRTAAPPLTPAASVKIRSRFFSVSPMYLSTTVARSTTYRSRPSSPAITSADIVLPVPESPANSAVTPAPAAAAGPHPPLPEHPLAVPGASRPALAAPCGCRAGARGRPSRPAARSGGPAARARPRSARGRRPARARRSAGGPGRGVTAAWPHGLRGRPASAAGGTGSSPARGRSPAQFRRTRHATAVPVRSGCSPERRRAMPGRCSRQGPTGWTPPGAVAAGRVGARR